MRFFVYLTTSLLISCLSLASESVKANTLSGKWEFQRPDVDCKETSIFDRDKLIIYSGDEVSNSVFILTQIDSALYRLGMLTTSTNGKKACGQNPPTPIGIGLTYFVRFNEDGSSFSLCRTPALDTCFGPFKQVR